MSTARVDFTRGAAERIAAAVRRVEQGDRDGAPLSFSRALDVPALSVRNCSWSGSWGYNQTHVVTFLAAGGKTAVAINRYFGFRPGFPPGTGNGEGIVVKGGGAFTGSWVLQCFSLALVDNYLESLPTNETVQFLGHGGTDVPEEDGQVGPFLKWHSITTCEASQ